MKILVVAERKERDVRRVTLEIAAKAKDLGETEVIEITGTERYVPTSHAAALAARAKDSGAQAILIGATLNGRDLAARTAAKLGWVYVADCTDLVAKDGALEARRPMYAGKVRATLRVALPAVVSVRPGAWTLPSGAAAVTPTEVKADTSGDTLAFARFEPTATASKRVSLSEARVIVSGGRGLKGPENWRMVEELADLLGARGDRRRLASERRTGRTDRQDGDARSLHRPGHLRRDPTSRGDDVEQGNRRGEQGPRRGHIQDRGLRRGGRSLLVRAGLHRGRPQREEGELMQPEPGSTERELAAAVRDWAAGLGTRIAEAEKAGRLPDDVIRELAALGVLGMTVPEADGGLGASSVAFALVLEELAYAWPSLAVGVSVNSGI